MTLPKGTLVSFCVVVIFVALLDAQSAASQTSAPQGKLTETEILALQRKFQAASVAADLPTLSALMDDNATFIHGNGLAQTKAQYINALTTGQMKLTAYEIKESKVTFFKDGAVVVALSEVGLAPARNAPAGAAPRLLRLRVSTVWLRKLEGWQLVLNQGTPLAAPGR
jgi:ketosteroid isomerase-like protein